MNKSNNSITVELAIHKNVIEHFHLNPLSDKQIISSSIRPEYDIMSIETTNYLDIIPTIQRFLPYIKVLMPIELDMKIREHLKDYDNHDLSKYTKIK